MSLLRKRLRTESALTPALACAIWPTSTARAASCPACRQRLGKGDESTLWGMGSGGGLSWSTPMKKHNIIESPAWYGRKHVSSATLPVTSWHITGDKCQYFSSTHWIQYVATHKTATSWRVHPLHLLLQFLLPFCLSMASDRQVTVKSFYLLMSPPSRSAQLMQGFLKQVESVWWIKHEYSGNSAPVRLKGLALKWVCDIGKKQLSTSSVLCRGIFLHLLTKLLIFKKKQRKKNVPFSSSTRW